MAIYHVQFESSASFIDAVGEAISASPKRQRLAQIIEIFNRDFPDQFRWATGPASPALLHNLMWEIIDAVSRKPESEPAEPQ